MYVADSMQWLSSLLPCLLAILETCSADFVFTIDLDRFTTNGRCDPGSFNTRCETYLNIYCLRGPSSQQSRDRGHCPLGKSAFGRLYEASTPTTRTITSPQPWPVSWFRLGPSLLCSNLYPLRYSPMLRVFTHYAAIMYPFFPKLWPNFVLVFKTIFNTIA